MKRPLSICICRLRQSIHYKQPLTTILDSFYECLLSFIRNNRQHEYYFYRFSLGEFDTARTPKDIAAIEQADVVIIPTEAEFNCWIPGKLHSLSVERSNKEVERIAQVLEGKKVIFLRSDRADSVSLYRAHTFSNQSDITYAVIDEDEFPLGIHGMKYHFIKHYVRNFKKVPRIYDLAYWGSDKSRLPNGYTSGDERHKVLRLIKDTCSSAVFWAIEWHRTD